MRVLILLLAGTMLAAGAASAQVAAPMLNTAVPQALGSINPGLLPFSGPSRVGAGRLGVEGSSETAGVTTPTFSSLGPSLQGLWVGKSLALEGEFDRFSAAGTTLKFTSLGAALQFGESFSLGLAQQTLYAPTGVGTLDQTLRMAGLSWRLGRAFYLGAVAGSETMAQDDGSNPVAEDTRAVRRYGLGYHWREGTRGLHIEAYRDQRDPITYSGTLLHESTTDGITLEGLTGNVVFGYEATYTSFIDNNGSTTTPSAADTNKDGKRYSVGWIPAKGLAVSLSYLNVRQQRVGSVTTMITEITALNVAWHY
jgi:hypothetical protein